MQLNTVFILGGRNDFISNMTLQHDLPSVTFKSAYYDLAYTNFVAGFHGTLDYIHFDANQLHCGATVPMPSHEEVTQLSALPNQKFPSDHVALVCDLNFK